LDVERSRTVTADQETMELKRVLLKEDTGVFTFGADAMKGPTGRLPGLTRSTKPDPCYTHPNPNRKLGRIHHIHIKQ